jgi:hypothetical protein
MCRTNSDPKFRFPQIQIRCPSYFRAARSKSCRASPEIWACRPEMLKNLQKYHQTIIFCMYKWFVRSDCLFFCKNLIAVWYKMIVWFFAKVITLFDLFGVHRLHAELENFVCTVENTPKATLTLMWIVVIQRKTVLGDWTRLKIANMLTEPHVDLNLQCQMHPSYLSNPSDLSPCLEQKLVAQLHTQCAPEIWLCFCGNHGAMLLFWNMLDPNQSGYRQSKEILDGC